MSEAESRFRSDPERIAAQVIDGEAVIIDLISGTYFSLAGSGGRVWELMESGCSLDQIAAVLAREYSVPETQTRADVERLFEHLREEGLVVCVAAADDAHAPLEGTVHPMPYQPPTLQIYRDMQDLLALDPPMPGLKDIPWK